MSSQDTSTALVATTTVISTVVFLVVARALLYPVQPKTIRNPLKLGVYDKLNADKVKNLVYQPDQFPGARDVETPVSNMSTCKDHQNCADLVKVWKYSRLRVRSRGWREGLFCPWH